jgi:hypothetical protein
MSSAIISASKRLAIIASPRATAIMKGLLKSGRVEPGVVIGNFVKLPHTGHRESYFVRADGQLLHGVSLARAEELCESFGDYLARVGELAEEQPSTG